MTGKKAGNLHWVIPHLIIACVVIDAIAFFNERNLNPSLAAFACSAQPFLVAAQVAFSHQITSYATLQCKQALPEFKAIAILLFEFKLHLAILAFALTCLGAIFLPSARRTLNEVRSNALQKPGPLAFLRDTVGMSLGFLSFCGLVLVQYSTTGEPSRFPAHAPILVRFSEDLVVFTFYITLSVLSATVYALCAGKDRSTHEEGI